MKMERKRAGQRDKGNGGKRVREREEGERDVVNENKQSDNLKHMDMWFWRGDFYAPQ